jgi:transposase
MNQLHVVALNEGLRCKKELWRAAGRKELESIALAPWARRRRQDLLDLLDQLTPKIQELTRALEDEVEKRPVTRQLMTHPGVGPLTALAFELVIGTTERFPVASKWPAMWGWCPLNNPVASADASDISASRATRCSGFCWWKRRRSRCAASPSGAVDSSI